MKDWFKETFFGTIREYIKMYGAERRSGWRKTRNAFVKKNPCCAICSKEKVHVHHVVPFHVDPRLELRFSNLISLCPRCHLLFGHLGWWKSWNINIEEDTKRWKNKFENRPHKE